MKDSSARLSRRKFLLAATAGTAATAAAVVGQQAADPVAARDEPKNKGSGGYQLTEHVRNYYRTARI